MNKGLICAVGVAFAVALLNIQNQIDDIRSALSLLSRSDKVTPITHKNAEDHLATVASSGNDFQIIGADVLIDRTIAYVDGYLSEGALPILRELPDDRMLFVDDLFVYDDNSEPRSIGPDLAVDDLSIYVSSGVEPKNIGEVITLQD